MSNNLDPDQDQHTVGPDLGPNCLQRLSTDDTGRQEIKQTNNRIQLFSRLGHKVNGVIERSEITDKGMVTSTKTLFPVGTVLYAKILRSV